MLVANLGGRCWVGGVGDVKLNVFLAKFIIKKKKKKLTFINSTNLLFTNNYFSLNTLLLFISNIILSLPKHLFFFTPSFLSFTFSL